MEQPMFSVIVPTRERAETLEPCLRTCLEQDFDDYEILVADNASTPATREVVTRLASDRIRYLRSDRVLAMSANWERAVSEARGRYLTVVGDDDALMPYALRELARLVEEYDAPPAIRWSRAIWTWPTIAVQEDASCLMLPMSRRVGWRVAREVIGEVIGFRASSEELPMIYNAVIRRDLVDSHRDRFGAVFPTIYPDIYSGFAFGWMSERYLSVDVPMGVAGLGGRSNGVATLMKEKGQPVADEFNSLNADFGYLPHPRVPDLPTPPIHVVDSFEQARDRFFPDDATLDYERWEMTQRYLATIPNQDEATRRRYQDLIATSLADRPDLQEQVEAEAARHPPSPWFRFRPDRLGYDGHSLRVDTSDFGIDDVHDLVRFVTRLLGYDDPRPIDYGLPDAGWLNAHIAAEQARAARAEATVKRLRDKVDRLRTALAEARADASLRRVPRRVAGRVRSRLTRHGRSTG